MTRGIGLAACLTVDAAGIPVSIWRNVLSTGHFTQAVPKKRPGPSGFHPSGDWIANQTFAVASSFRQTHTVCRPDT